MRKLDKSKVQWIIHEKQKGAKNHRIVETMGISTCWVKTMGQIQRNRAKI